MLPATQKTYNEQLLEIKELYRESGNPWPATSKQIAIWAINQGHYKTHRAKLIAKAAEEFSSAMGQEYYTDAKGRRVRTMHVARQKQKMLWDDIRSADRDFMERAFQLRRRHIVGECKQLSTDIESYNDDHPNEKPIQKLMDFRDDVAEATQPKDYNPKKPR